MGLEDILSAIERDALAEERRVAEEAEREVALLLEEARGEAARLEAEALARARAEAAGRAARTLSQARQEVAGRMRAAEEAGVQAALAAARARLEPAREGPGYPRLLRAFLDLALAAVPDADEVAVDPRDEALARAALRSAGSAAKLATDIPTSGGAEARAEEGRVRARSTIEERLSRAEPHLRAEVGRTAREDVARGERGGEG
jgi:vacuolar-type H+-ATPase subunit E/Vma4